MGILAVLALFLLAMRFTDGPIAVFTGGPFTSGTTRDAPDDWSYLKAVSYTHLTLPTKA